MTLRLEKKTITPADLKVGTVYFGKRRKTSHLTDATNDRIILWMGLGQLQYDSDTVSVGQKQPRVTHEQFCKWAAGIVHEDKEEQNG